MYETCTSVCFDNLPTMRVNLQFADSHNITPCNNFTQSFQSSWIHRGWFPTTTLCNKHSLYEVTPTRLYHHLLYMPQSSLSLAGPLTDDPSHLVQPVRRKQPGLTHLLQEGWALLIPNNGRHLGHTQLPHTQQLVPFQSGGVCKQHQAVALRRRFGGARHCAVAFRCDVVLVLRLAGG